MFKLKKDYKPEGIDRKTTPILRKEVQWLEI